MSAFKVVRDSAGRVRGCGPNDGTYDPAVPPGYTLGFSDVFMPIDPTPVEQSSAQRTSMDETERADCKLDAAIMVLVNQTKAEWVAWAGTNFPTLTAPERNKLGQLFWFVSVGGRSRVRNGAL